MQKFVFLLYPLSFIILFFGKYLVENYLYNSILSIKLLAMIQLNILLLIFIMFGWICNKFYTKVIRLHSFIILLTINITFFLLTKYITKLFSNNVFDIFTTSYFIALMTFIFMMVISLMKKYHSNKILSFFADISYPLYATHAIVGYIIMYLCLNAKLSQNFTLIFVTIYVIYIAYIIHVKIEKPYIKIGKMKSNNSTH